MRGKNRSVLPRTGFKARFHKKTKYVCAVASKVPLLNYHLQRGYYHNMLNIANTKRTAHKAHFYSHFLLLERVHTIVSELL